MCAQAFSIVMFSQMVEWCKNNDANNNNNHREFEWKNRLQVEHSIVGYLCTVWRCITVIGVIEAVNSWTWGIGGISGDKREEEEELTEGQKKPGDMERKHEVQDEER